MNPYQPGEDNQDPYEVGYKAGAASRDAEIAKLKEDHHFQACLTKYLMPYQERAVLAEKERDQLREQLAEREKVASRDAEIVSLTNQRDYEYVRAENAEQERDQLREQVKIARGYFEAIIDPIAYMRSKLENEQQLNGQMAIQLSENHSYLKGLAKKALATTEPKQ